MVRLRLYRFLSAAYGRLGQEKGVTLVEVVVAVMIIGIGSLAVLQVFDASTRTNFRAEQSQVANNVAQRELERIRSLSYRQVALTSQPTFVDDDNDPRQRVDGTRFDASDNGAFSEMVFNGGPLEGGGSITNGAVAAGPTDFASGDVTGEIFRFVVWRNDPTCSESACPGSQDLKRAIVAVLLDTGAATYERPYIEVQSDFIDPRAGVAPEIPGGSGVDVAQFWLTDTPCVNDARQAIVTDPETPNEGHTLHNTLGPCSAGRQSGPTPGAPDLLDIEPPPDPNLNDVNDPPILDYATDLERTGDPLPPDDDGGLQMIRQDVNGCAFNGGTGDTAYQKVHRWVTRPINAAQLPTGFAMDGTATVELFLRSLGDANHPGRICTYLFRRNSAGVDTTFDQHQFSVDPWPSGAWERVRIPLTFGSTTIQPDQRLGLAISIERGGTPAETVQILYDHPEAQSRLEVKSPTPVGE
jgi:prepilin-type N-terminal cleavage/methylation domain-containing protein